MSQRSFTFPVAMALVLFAAGCKSTAPDPVAQSLVESMAASDPDIVRLTVHMAPKEGEACCAVASTAPDKLGQPSDPEDLRAIESGEVVVLDEPGAVDVTVPVMATATGHDAAVGVTLKSGPDADRTALIARAKRIAMAVESGLTKDKSGG
jgi:hypothetical protein